MERRGASAIGAARHYLAEEEEDGRETAQWIEKAGRSAVRIPGDIRNEDHCERIIKTCVDRFGTVDILVNNAAFQSTHDDATEISTEVFDRAFKTNVYATFFLSRAALRHMKAGASILNPNPFRGSIPAASCCTTQLPKARSPI